MSSAPPNVYTLTGERAGGVGEGGGDGKGSAESFKRRESHMV